MEKGKIPPDMCCPARFLVSESSWVIKVKYVEIHNHPLSFHNTRFHKVPESVLLYIKTCLHVGMTPKAFEKSLQGNLGKLGMRDEDAALKKEQFVTLRYIKRIREKMKLDGRLHPHDAQSVRIFAENLQPIERFKVKGLEEGKNEFSGVLVYKPQGSPTTVGNPGLGGLPHSDDLFVLGVQTKAQYDMMVKGSQVVICMDATHSTNHYDFQLLNAVVPDKYGVDYPVAHFILNHQNEETLALVLESFKVRVPPNFKINLFMADDDRALHNAIFRVFEPMLLRRGLRKWHVHQAWQRRLRSEIPGDIALRNTVYNSLMVLMEERKEESFPNMKNNFVINFTNKCSGFVYYFIKEYEN